MARNIVEPKIEDAKQYASSNRTKVTHPAYAQIKASRVNGTANLYGSDFTHDGYVTIEISRSELYRDLSTDWPHATNELIRVQLSEAQWATFVSCLNVGGGVQCTLDHIGLESVPQLPKPASRSDQFASEAKTALADSLQNLIELREKIAGLGLSKTKANVLLDEVNASIGQLNNHIPFVAQRFEEHTEEVMEAAKTEIHGYMTNVIQRAGIRAITNGTMPLVIENKSGQ